jgi:hypothetical protein
MPDSYIPTYLGTIRTLFMLNTFTLYEIHRFHQYVEVDALVVQKCERIE